MSFENPSTPAPERKEKELTLAERLGEALRTEGLAGERTKQCIQEWWTAREALSDEARWEADLQRAEILFSAGFVNEALEEYESIAQQAYEAQKDDIVARCDERIEAITHESPSI
ncbi:MAG: hypothetical protein QY311_00710 [Candidatus Paceibacterota bacterium]|nr:MAG: hypothetical protein QY311_00710 [Candidatus Paceibacterota bacterium]